VRTISTTQEQRAVVTQELQMRRAETTDMEYLIPLDLGAPMQDLFYTPARNYTNPTTLTDLPKDDIDFEGIYSLYPPWYGR
jgi:hypothetical protein